MHTRAGSCTRADSIVETRLAVANECIEMILSTCRNFRIVVSAGYRGRNMDVVLALCDGVFVKNSAHEVLTRTSLMRAIRASSVADANVLIAIKVTCSDPLTRARILMPIDGVKVVVMPAEMPAGMPHPPCPWNYTSDHVKRVTQQQQAKKA